MNTFLKYAWPLISSVVLQILVVTTLPVKPGWFLGRIALFVLVDIAIGFLQWLRFKHDQRWRQIQKRLGLEVED